MIWPLSGGIQLQLTIGKCIRFLKLVANVMAPSHIGTDVCTWSMVDYNTVRQIMEGKLCQLKVGTVA